MVERSADYAARAMSGRVSAGDPGVLWRSAVLDSRRARGGEIFFALRGEHADGHDFVAQAAERGAAVVVVERDVDSGSAVRVRVDDVYAGLHALTRAVRAEVPKKLVGLTGSVGKTTTKELLAAMLERHFGRVAKSTGNFNNLYGFPLSLLAIPDASEWMVAEMGMSTPGELGGVSRLGRPDAVLLLNVRPAHLASFSDLRGIAEAKAEILGGLPADGLLVANADDPEVERVARRWQAMNPAGRLVRFAFAAEDADVRATRPEPRSPFGSRFELSAGGETVTIELAVHGLYNAENCLAAAATAHALGVPPAAIRDAAAAFTGHDGQGPGRGRVVRLRGGVTLVDDCYNANPNAVENALESARALPGERFLAVLGDMLELGPEAAMFHRQVGEKAAALGFTPLFGVGELARELVAAAGAKGVTCGHFGDAAQAAAGLPAAVRDGDVVLVKGSRGVGLERAVAALVAARGVEGEDG